jgi:hypothetical protein
MFNISQEMANQSGIDEKPVMLAGDTVKGWEIFLSILYPEYYTILSMIFPLDLLKPTEIH